MPVNTYHKDHVWLFMGMHVECKGERIHQYIPTKKKKGLFCECKSSISKTCRAIRSTFYIFLLSSWQLFTSCPHKHTAPSFLCQDKWAARSSLPPVALTSLEHSRFSPPSLSLWNALQAVLNYWHTRLHMDSLHLQERQEMGSGGWRPLCA